MNRSKRAAKFATIVLLSVFSVLAQNGEPPVGDVYSSGDSPAQRIDVFGSGNTDLGPCGDPRIAARELRENARAYHDTNGRGKAIADLLARKYSDPFVSKENGTHPVSGARIFGFRSLGNGKY